MWLTILFKFIDTIVFLVDEARERGLIEPHQENVCNNLMESCNAVKHCEAVRNDVNAKFVATGGVPDNADPYLRDADKSNADDQTVVS